MIRLYAIRSKQHKSARTINGRGTVQVTRTEWGVGKGQWKRDAKKLDAGVEVRTLWLGPYARYTLAYEGPYAQAIYDAL